MDDNSNLAGQARINKEKEMTKSTAYNIHLMNYSMRRAEWNRQVMEEQPKLNEMIHDGLLFALKREVPDWQEWLNECDDYPYILYYSRKDEMDAMFKAMHERIVDEMFAEELQEVMDFRREREELLITI